MLWVGFFGGAFLYGEWQGGPVLMAASRSDYLWVHIFYAVFIFGPPILVLGIGLLIRRAHRAEPTRRPNSN